MPNLPQIVLEHYPHTELICNDTTFRLVRANFLFQRRRKWSEPLRATSTRHTRRTDQGDLWRDRSVTGRLGDI